MRALGGRLVVILVAATLVGLTALDVAFVLWSLEAEARARDLHLQSAAQELAYRTSASPTPLTQAELESLAREREVTLAVVDPAGEALRSGPVPAALLDGARTTAEGWVAATRVTADGRRALAAVPLRDTIDRVLFGQRSALLLLLGVGALIVVTGGVLLRRGVSRPIDRMSVLVGAADVDALEVWAGRARDPLANLGRKVSALTRRIDDDRQQIAAQLEALQRAHRELQATQEQLVRAERLAVVGELAAGLAHEVGNPLAIIRGFVDLMLDDASDLDTRQRALPRISKELDRIQGTLGALLDFSRMPRSAAGEGDLAEALRHVEALLRPQERLRGVTLEMTPPGDAPPVGLTTDALVQILLNICLNAAHALDHQGRIAVHATCDAGRCTLTIDDDGPGVPPELRPRIFAPFFTTKGAGEGTGLGLAVCEQMLASVGGGIAVSDSPYGGARFTVWFPTARAR